MRLLLLALAIRPRAKNNGATLECDDLKFQDTDRILHRHPALPSLASGLRSGFAAAQLRLAPSEYYCRRERRRYNSGKEGG